MTIPVVAVEERSGVPAEFVLRQNYPNPFNPATTISYELPERSHVIIGIYDLAGRRIRILVNATEDAGYKSVAWDATNDSGRPVSAGVYLYQIQSEGFTQSRKMVLLK